MDLIPLQSLGQHLRHPFSFSAQGKTITLSNIEKIKALALFILGLLISIVGGPLAFYAYTQERKEIRAKTLQLPLLRPPSAPPDPVPLPPPVIPQPTPPVVQQPLPPPQPQPLPLPPVVQPQPTPTPPVVQPLPTPTPPVIQPQPVPLPPPAPVPKLTPIPLPSPVLPPLLEAKPVPDLKAALPIWNPIEAFQKNVKGALEDAATKPIAASYGQLSQALEETNLLLLSLGDLDQHLLNIEMNYPILSKSAADAKNLPTGLRHQLQTFIENAYANIRMKMGEHPIDAGNMAQEVAIMTAMPRSLQQLRLEKLLETQYQIRQVDGDGNCGPRSIAAAYNHSDHLKIRNEVVDYMRRTQDIRDALVDADDYLDGMRRPDTYFGDPEFAAFAQKEQQPIGVISIENIQVKNNRLCPQEHTLWGSGYPKKPILLFHRSVLPGAALNHYDLLIPKS